MTFLYSVLHMLVDGICALTMFGLFLAGEDGYFQILVYNFCAFALQMPFGVLLDRWYAASTRSSEFIHDSAEVYSSLPTSIHPSLGSPQSKKDVSVLDGTIAQRNVDKGMGTNGQSRKSGRWELDPACLTAIAGVLFTIAGAFTNPAILGIGNALFHVGGGVGCIKEDMRKNWKGKGLGIFVAPGALGLYLGTLAAKQGLWMAGYLGTGALLLLLCAGTLCAAGYQGKKKAAGENGRSGDLKALVCCLVVVVLRSYIGMAVFFPWKTSVAAGCLAVLAVVGGKAAGGFAAAKYGGMRTAVVSLAAAAGCYLFSSSMPVGLAALFLFNMTMPVTLYWMVRSMPEMPGLAFGFLTFALFLGFLPVYFGLIPAVGSHVVGCAGSVLSLILLAFLLRAEPERS